MKYFLTHVQDWLTFGGSTIPGGEWIFLFVLLLSATIILNIVTDTSDIPRMTANFLFLAGGALLGSLIIPDWSPPLDPTANFIFALFSGMAAGALVNLVLLKPL